jgi:hypothetical protein
MQTTLTDMVCAKKTIGMCFQWKCEQLCPERKRRRCWRVHRSRRTRADRLELGQRVGASAQDCSRLTVVCVWAYFEIEMDDSDANDPLPESGEQRWLEHACRKGMGASESVCAWACAGRASTAWAERELSWRGNRRRSCQRAEVDLVVHCRAAREGTASRKDRRSVRWTRARTALALEAVLDTLDVVVKDVDSFVASQPCSPRYAPLARPNSRFLMPAADQVTIEMGQTTVESPAERKDSTSTSTSTSTPFLSQGIASLTVAVPQSSSAQEAALAQRPSAPRWKTAEFFVYYVLVAIALFFMFKAPMNLSNRTYRTE